MLDAQRQDRHGHDTILNPYYNQPAQGLLDPNGWYNPYTTAIAPNLNGVLNTYISPITSSLILNYRHDKLAITPSFAFQTGGFYGSPLDVDGSDPRACMLNSATTGITKLSPKTNPLQCNYLTHRGGSGRVRLPLHPESADGNVCLRQLSAAELDRRKSPDHLRPEPADQADGAGNRTSSTRASAARRRRGRRATPPSYVVCGYTPAGGSLNSTLYPGNFYNGTGINDFAANKARTPAPSAELHADRAQQRRHRRWRPDPSTSTSTLGEDLTASPSAVT